MINDFIHMTQVEFMIKYWWIWLAFVLIAVIHVYWGGKKRK